MSSAAAAMADVGTVGEALDALAARLRGAVAEPRREAREIVAALLDVSRGWPAAHPDTPWDAACDAAARAAADRLAGGAPFAYAVGRAWFRHLTLAVDERVLIPRPETELLVDLVLGETDGGRGVAVDVGTGSGAIALALAAEGRFDRVLGTDLSLDALAVARANAERLAGGLRSPVEFVHGSLLAPLRDRRFAVVVANPPYIADGEAEALPAAVRDWEPSVALFSGPDGLDASRRLVREAAVVLEPGGLLAIEVDARRAGLAADLLVADGRYRDVVVRLDLVGRERFVSGRRG